MSKKQLKKFYKNSAKIAKNNGYEYDVLKAVEELNELATVLIQSLTKKKQDTSEHIHEEFGDVDFRLAILRNHFDPISIKERARVKMEKSIGYLKTQKYDKV